MSIDNKKTPLQPATNSKSRNDLLDELESIRSLLDGDTHISTHNEEHNAAVGHIPVLLPDDSIPTLGSEHRHHNNPLRRAKKNKHHSDNNLPATTHTLLSTTRSREKLVDDVVRSAMPRLEAILRELVQEALLQDKLRGGKR
ncbi:MAG: hypothetical protein R3E61_01890 [Pseudomonadales bacterium]